MRVVYVAQIEIEVPDTRAKHMAVHEASKHWPAIEERIREVAADVTVASIRVAPAAKAAAGTEEE